MMKNLKKLVNMPIKVYALRQFKCFFYMLLYSLASLVFPGFIGYIVDDGIMINDIRKIIFYCTAMLLTGVLMTGFRYLEQISFYKLAQEIIVELKEKLYNMLSNKNIKFWSNNTSGDMFTVLENDVNRLENLVTTTFGDIIVNSFIGIGIASYLIWIDAGMGVSVLILSLTFAYAQRLLGNKAEKMMEDLRRRICVLSGFTDEAINNMLNIQVSGYSKYMEKVYVKENRNVIHGSVQQMKLIAAMRGVGGAFNVLGVLAVLIMGAIRVRQGTLSIGVLFSLTIYVQRLYSPIVGLGTAYIEIRNSKPIIKKILSVMEDENNITSGTYIPDAGIVQGKIEFKNLSFGYNKDQLLFRDFNLIIRPNSIVGIVGKNGSGKTTLIRLLTKLCTPLGGEILLDETDIEKYDTAFLRRQIGYMQQSEFFFKGKLRTILDPYLQMDSRELTRLMGVFRVSIDLFQDGLDTEISENMLNLSGGEVQKIAMVRLFCENKPIYILDEPTAALDIHSEDEIIPLLKVLLKDKTSIVITHKKKILDICDEIVHL